MDQSSAVKHPCAELFRPWTTSDSNTCRVPTDTSTPSNSCLYESCSTISVSPFYLLSPVRGTPTTSGVNPSLLTTVTNSGLPNQQSASAKRSLYNAFTVCRDSKQNSPYKLNNSEREESDCYIVSSSEDSMSCQSTWDYSKTPEKRCDFNCKCCQTTLRSLSLNKDKNIVASKTSSLLQNGGLVPEDFADLTTSSQLLNDTSRTPCNSPLILKDTGQCTSPISIIVSGEDSDIAITHDHNYIKQQHSTPVLNIQNVFHCSPSLLQELANKNDISEMIKQDKCRVKKIRSDVSVDNCVVEETCSIKTSDSTNSIGTPFPDGRNVKQRVSDEDLLTKNLQDMGMKTVKINSILLDNKSSEATESGQVERVSALVSQKSDKVQSSVTLTTGDMLSAAAVSNGEDDGSGVWSSSPSEHCSEESTSMEKNMVTPQVNGMELRFRPFSSSSESSSQSKKTRRYRTETDLLIQETAQFNSKFRAKSTPRCPRCQRSFRSQLLLDDHYQHHDTIHTRSGSKDKVNNHKSRTTLRLPDRQHGVSSYSNSSGEQLSTHHSRVSSVRKQAIITVQTASGSDERLGKWKQSVRKDLEAEDPLLIEIVTPKKEHYDGRKCKSDIKSTEIAMQPRKRGRPRKLVKDFTGLPSYIKSTDFTTPRKKGRPRKMRNGFIGKPSHIESTKIATPRKWRTPKKLVNVIPENQSGIKSTESAKNQSHIKNTEITTPQNWGRPKKLVNVFPDKQSGIKSTEIAEKQSYIKGTEISEKQSYIKSTEIAEKQLYIKSTEEITIPRKRGRPKKLANVFTDMPSLTMDKPGNKSRPKKKSKWKKLFGANSFNTKTVPRKSGSKESSAEVKTTLVQTRPSGQIDNESKSEEHDGALDVSFSYSDCEILQDKETIEDEDDDDKTIIYSLDTGEKEWDPSDPFTVTTDSSFREVRRITAAQRGVRTLTRTEIEKAFKAAREQECSVTLCKTAVDTKGCVYRSDGESISPYSVCKGVNRCKRRNEEAARSSASSSSTPVKFRRSSPNSDGNDSISITPLSRYSNSSEKCTAQASTKKKTTSLNTKDKLANESHPDKVVEKITGLHTNNNNLMPLTTDAVRNAVYDCELDFEAALVEMQLINEGLPPFVGDKGYVDAVKKRAGHGKMDHGKENICQKKSVERKKGCVHKAKTILPRTVTSEEGGIQNMANSHTKDDHLDQNGRTKEKRKKKDRGGGLKSSSKKKSSKSTSSKVQADQGVQETTGNEVVDETKKIPPEEPIPETTAGPKFKLVWTNGGSHGQQDKVRSKEQEETTARNGNKGDHKQKKQRDPKSLTQCRYCDEIMARCEIAEHKVQKHPFPCRMCKLTFSEQKSRDHHISQDHTGIECKLCQKNFSSPSGLRRHLLTKKHQDFERVQKQTMDQLYKKSHQAEKIVVDTISMDSQAGLQSGFIVNEEHQEVDEHSVLSDSFLAELGFGNQVAMTMSTDTTGPTNSYGQKEPFSFHHQEEVAAILQVGDTSQQGQYYLPGQSRDDHHLLSEVVESGQDSCGSHDYNSTVLPWEERRGLCRISNCTLTTLQPWQQQQSLDQAANSIQFSEQPPLATDFSFLAALDLVSL